MPRRTTAFNMGTRANYDYQFTGYQGGASNVFRNLADAFGSGTRAEQGSALQARHALLMGAVDNSNYLARHQGVSDIDFEDTQRRASHSDEANKDLTNWYAENHPHLLAYVSGRDSRGNASVAKGVNVSLQQGHAAQYLSSFGIGGASTTGTSSTPSGPASSVIRSSIGGPGRAGKTTDVAHPAMSPTQFGFSDNPPSFTNVDRSSSEGWLGRPWYSGSPGQAHAASIKANIFAPPAPSAPETTTPKPAAYDTNKDRPTPDFEATAAPESTGGSGAKGGKGPVTTVHADESDSGSDKPEAKA